MDLILKPILTEKTNAIEESLKVYTFRVTKEATKGEIKAAVESTYDVHVTKVRTLRTATKRGQKFTKTGVVQSMKGSFKKAFVTVKEGESIDIYNL